MRIRAGGTASFTTRKLPPTRGPPRLRRSSAAVCVSAPAPGRLKYTWRLLSPRLAWFAGLLVAQDLPRWSLRRAGGVRRGHGPGQGATLCGDRRRQRCALLMPGPDTAGAPRRAFAGFKRPVLLRFPQPGLLLGFVSYFFGRQTGCGIPPAAIGRCGGEAEKCSPDAGPPSNRRPPLGLI